MELTPETIISPGDQKEGQSETVEQLDYQRLSGFELLLGYKHLALGTVIRL